jgi:hypothetical protein
MKTLFALIAYTILSVLIGLLVRHFQRKAGNTGAAMISAVIFFGLPPLSITYVVVRDWIDHWQWEKDVAYVQELCAKQGGTKIYRTVDNVEGIFQMRARPARDDVQWRDQFGLHDPWGLAWFDFAIPAIGIGSGSGQPGRVYWFLEQQPGVSVEGPPYRRRFSTDDRDPGVVVAELRSRYGYVIDDLSTHEMRSRWIAGGRIRIIDLSSQELLAEQTGFFRAFGAQFNEPWRGVTGSVNFCHGQMALHAFVMQVLKPPPSLPTESQLESLRGK